MKGKSVPMRMCVACREMKDKRELLRVVRSPDGDVGVDDTGKKSGRGAYVCKNEACLRKCLKTGQLKRALEAEISDEVKELLLERIGERLG